MFGSWLLLFIDILQTGQTALNPSEHGVEFVVVRFVTRQHYECMIVKAI